MKKQILKLTTAIFSLLVIVVACNKDVNVTGVTLNKSSLTLALGASEVLIATIQPIDATNQVLIWESSNPFVATVLGNGLVTALSPGETTVVVRTEDGNKTASCMVKVERPATKEDLLSQEKGWKLIAGTCEPPYESWDGTLSSDLFEVFLFDCERDDIIFFYKNHTQYLNYGKFLCDWESGTGVNLGYWSIKEDENLLDFYLSYFLDENDNFARLEGKIIVLDDNTLKLDIPLVFDDGSKLAKRGLISSDAKAVIDYVFTLTYRKV
jgi:hypothetical protein